MKKILSIISAFFLALILVGCTELGPIQKDPAQKTLDTAYSTLAGLIEKPEEISAGFKIPAALLGGVEVEWTSSEPGVVSLGQPEGGFINVTITRPSFEDGDQKVTLTAVLSIPATLTSEVLTKEWQIELTILATEEVKIEAYESLGDLYEDMVAGLLPQTNFRTETLAINNVSLYSKTTVGYFLKDEFGKLAYVHGVASAPEAGKLFNITAKVYNYFGYLQLEDVGFKAVDGTPTVDVNYVETTVQEVQDFLIPSNDNMVYPYALKLKNVMFHIDKKADGFGTDESQYNLVILPFGYDFSTAVRSIEGNLHYLESIMVYYTSLEFNELRALVGQEILELDVIYEGYRTDRYVKYVSIVGLESVTLSGVMTDEVAVNGDTESLTQPVEVLASKEGALTLPLLGENGSTISWSLSEGHADLVDITNGNVVIPADHSQVEVTLTATISRGSYSKTKVFTLYIGEPQVFSIADAKEVLKGRTIQISGVVLGNSANNTVIIQDATGGIAIYGSVVGKGTLKDVKRGDLVTVIGKKDLYNGLHQIGSGYTLKETVEDVLPEPANLDLLPKFNDANLLPLQSQRVSASELKVVAYALDSYGNVSMTLERLDGEQLEFKWDSRAAFEGSAALAAIKLGDYVKLEGALLGWYKGAQVSADNANAVVVLTEISAEAQLKEAKLALELEKLHFEEEGTLVLPLEVKGVSVSWELENVEHAALVDLSTGVVSPDGGYTEVTLIATLTVGSNTVTKEFVVIVGSLVEAEEVLLFSKLENATSYVTVPTAFELDGYELVRLNANISQQGSGSKGVVLGLRSGNSFNDAYLQVKLEGAVKVAFDVENWTTDAVNNISFAKAIYLQTSVDGQTWVNVKDFLPTWKTEESATNLLELELEEDVVFVRLYLESTKPTSTYQLRLIVKSVTVTVLKAPVLESVEVTFDYNDGVTEPNVVTLEKGTQVSKPANPKRSGYNFVGWYDADFSNEFDFDTNVEENVVLYAKWEEVTTMTIAEARAKAKGDEVIIKGVVTGVAAWSDKYGNFTKAFIQDETGAIALYGAKLPKEVQIGDVYQVKGKIDIYNGLVQITNNAEYTKLDEVIAIAAPVEITSLDELVVDLQGMRVSFKAEVVSTDAYGRTLTLKLGDKTIQARSSGNTDPINAHILTLPVGFEVLVNGMHLDWYNGGQLYPIYESELELVSLSDEDLVDLAKAELLEAFDGKTFNMGSAFVLDESKLHGVLVSFTTDPLGAVTEDNKWADVLVDTEVDLVFLLELGEVSLEVGVAVTVKFVGEDTKVEKTGIATSPNNSKTYNTGSTNDGSILNLSSEAFQIIVTGSANLGTYSEIRIYGQRSNGDGAEVTFKALDGREITAIEIVFAKSTENYATKITMGETIVELSKAESEGTLTYTGLSLSQFSIKNVGEGGDKNAQVRIASIKITYLE